MQGVHENCSDDSQDREMIFLTGKKKFTGKIGKFSCHIEFYFTLPVNNRSW